MSPSLGWWIRRLRKRRSCSGGSGSISRLSFPLENIRRSRRERCSGSAPHPNRKLTGSGLAPQPAALNRPARGADHLAPLVDDLLDVGRITQGKLVLRKQKVAFASVVEQALEAVRPLIEEQGLVARLSKAKTEPSEEMTSD